MRQNKSYFNKFKLIHSFMVDLFPGGAHSLEQTHMEIRRETPCVFLLDHGLYLSSKQLLSPQHAE